MSLLLITIHQNLKGMDILIAGDAIHWKGIITVPYSFTVNKAKCTITMPLRYDLKPK
jgi:hypothetical protein